jgi:hypothetical protein
MVRNRLRELRKANNPVPSIDYVARFYRGGVSRQWLSHLEKAKTVSATVELDYRAALSAAIADRKEATEILDFARKLKLASHAASSAAV